MPSRYGLLGLATALAATAIAVVVLVVDGSDQTNQATDGFPRCQIELPGGKSEIRFNAVSPACAEARHVYTRYVKAAAAEETVSSKAVYRAGGWSCRLHPITAYPRFLRCEQRPQRFDVISLTPIVHTTQLLTKSRASKPILFQTANGTVACRISRTNVLCETFARAWIPPPMPTHCTKTWGHLLELRRDKARFLCMDHTLILPDGETGIPILGTGDSAGKGQFTCEMLQKGLHCQTEQHGFLLSFQDVRLF